MSLILSWKNKDSGLTETARFDVVTNESIESIMAITSHPVEDGSDVSDHARQENKRITIEGYVSNKPLFSNPGVVNLLSYTTTNIKIPIKQSGRRPRRVKLNLPQPPLKPNVAALLSAAVTSIVGAIKGGTYAQLAPEDRPGPSSIQASVFRSTGSFPNRARQMYEVLERLQTSKILVTATIAVAELDNMMIERLHVPRTGTDGNGATFQIDLARLRIVKSETVSAPIPAEARGALQSAAGSKSAKDNKDDTKAKAQLESIASDLFGATGLRKITGIGL